MLDWNETRQPKRPRPVTDDPSQPSSIDNSSPLNPVDAQPHSSLPPCEHASKVLHGQIAARHCDCVPPAHAVQDPLRVSMRRRQQWKHRAAPAPRGRGAGIATSRYFASAHCPRPLAPAPVRNLCEVNPRRPGPSRRTPETTTSNENFYRAQGRHCINDVVTSFS